jgi:FkbM family methyltransferase
LNTPLYQPTNLPPAQSNIIVLCSNDDIKNIPDVFHDYNVKLVITDKPSDEKIILSNNTIQVDSDLTKIFEYLNCYIVIFCPTINDSMLFVLNRKLNELNIRHKYLFTSIIRKSAHQLYYPELLDKFRDELERVFSLLNDDESRKIFVSRIKSIMTGDIGYIRQSKYEQYFHPEVIPQNGDIIIDGGVGTSISVERKLSEFIGDRGHIYSFEPEPNCCSKVANQVKNIKNMTLFSYGLWNKSDHVHITNELYASRVVDNQTDNTNVCRMTTIDSFVSEYNINKIDIIKLDIEGSERNALLGSINTINKHKPKLLISLYHKHKDIFELPFFIDDLSLNYKFYIGHHSPTVWETTLYAVPG